MRVSGKTFYSFTMTELFLSKNPPCIFVKTMRKQLAILFLIAAVSYGSAIAQRAKYVVLISIDGMRPEFYKDPSWPAPTLQQLKKEGSYADHVKPVFPSVTLPNHTSMITGAMPARHGIYYNTPFEPEGATGIWNWETSRILVPTIWDAARTAGLKTASVDWPVNVGGPIDYNFPCIWAVDTTKDNIQVLKANTTPSGLWDELEKNATGRLLSSDIDGSTLRSDENKARIAAYIIRTYKPSFIAVHVSSTDEAEHEYGREGVEVRKAVAAVDRAVGDILEAIEKAGIKDSTAVLIAGDHGFYDIHSTLYPNTWLKKNNLLGSGKDWRVKFQSSSGAAFLHLQNPSDSTTLKAVIKLIADLPPSERKLFRVIDKPALTAIGADPTAELALSPTPGIAIGLAVKDSVLLPAMQKGTHGYYPDTPEIMTGFIAIGCGIRSGVVIQEMGTPDIAPIIATLLGLPFKSPDGVLYPGIIKK